MKNNFFKSYFKAFGIVAPLIAILAFGVLGYVVYISKGLLGTELIRIIYGAMISLLGCCAVVGLSKLKNDKVGFIDFIRVIGLISSLVLAIMLIVANGSKKSLFVYAVLAAVFLVEIIFRAIFADDDVVDSPIKNYLGAIAGTYNPIIILLLSIIVSVVATILAANNITNAIPLLKFISNPTFKYLAMGMAIAVIFVLFVPAIDRNTDVTLFDLALSVAFVSSLYLIFLSMNQVSVKMFKLLVLVFVASAGAVLVRGICYNKGRGYDNPAHKARTYFKQVYENYDITFFLVCGAVLILLFGVPTAKAIGGSNPIAKLFGSIGDAGITASVIIALVIMLTLIVLTFIFRNFKSTKVEKVDALLVSMLFASSFMVPFAVVTFINDGGELTVLTNNVMLFVLFIANLLLFIFAAIIQFIRLRNFDPLFALVGNAKPVVKEENEVAEEVEEEVSDDTEEENDPFALTEDDEALYESYYGVEEKEEPVQEEVTEEAQVEETVEEVVEEVVEETTETQDDESDDSLEEDFEDSDDEDEEEEEEPSSEEDEEDIPVEEPKKEADVIVQDFTLVDEEGKPKKIKRRFNTKMMFAPYETKEYYNEIKNYLMLYRAKGRYSARCESFRYKGLVAKVALGGKSIKVFLALDPSFVENNPKYHLKDVSEKKQYTDVPVMLKVRSPRSLKYFKELVDIMMAARLVKPKRNYQPVNFVPQLIPNGEAILATLGMSTDYLHSTMNVRSIPEEMPDNLGDYIPMIPAEPLEEDEVEVSIYLDTLCNHFEDGDEITLDILKQLHIVNRGNVLRIKARGTLDRKLIIYAEKFDEDALKMLMCTSCTAIKIVR
ncbi:MAG: hypothetical protein ACI35S_03565 [Anaeroplasma sp.]